MSDMRRREFITLLGGAAAAWPLAARAQQPAKLPTIGFLGQSTPSAESQWVDAFVQRLRELGWIEGRTVAIEYRWAEGRTERLAEIAAEFVRLKVDVIVTSGTAVVAAKQATSVIPIVFAVVGDPVGSGWSRVWRDRAATSPACRSRRPILPASESNSYARLFPVSAVWRSWPMSAIPAAVLEMGEVQAAARTLGLEVCYARNPASRGYRACLRGAQGPARKPFISCPDPLINTNRIRINTLALGARLPTMYNVREYVEAGGLMSYGPNFPDLFRRAADFVDKILRGAKPGDIPVEQPTKFDLVINLTTAKALGLEVPPTLLARADEVIE